MSSLSTPTPSLGTLAWPGGLQRGTVVGVDGRAGVSTLTLRLIAEALDHGGWGAAVGWPELGAEAALELGVALDHLALVPYPGPQWLDVVGALVDSLDLVVLRPPARVKGQIARRIAARARERGCVVVVALIGPTSWPESFDARFVANRTSWRGLGHGFGTARERQLEVAVDGRRIPSLRSARLFIRGTDDGFTCVALGDVAQSNDDGFAITA